MGFFVYSLSHIVGELFVDLYMNKILKLDANLFFAISIISFCIGGFWMSYAEEKNIIQLGLIVLGGLTGISGGIIGFMQSSEIIKKSKESDD